MFLIFFYGLFKKKNELKVTPVLVLGTVTHGSLRCFVS